MYRFDSTKTDMDHLKYNKTVIYQRIVLWDLFLNELHIEIIVTPHMLELQVIIYH